MKTQSPGDVTIDGGGSEAIDDVAFMGYALLLAWFAYLVVTISSRQYGQLLWLCRIALLGSAIGMLSRSRLILTAQFVGTLAFHAAWLFEHRLNHVQVVAELGWCVPAQLRILGDQLFLLLVQKHANGAAH